MLDAIETGRDSRQQEAPYRLACVRDATSERAKNLS